MALTRKEVEHVARLARLSLTEEEKERFSSQLDQILSYVEKLKEPDTGEVPPTAHPFSSETPLREDSVNRFQDRDGILKNAPEREESYFKVKKVIE